MVGNSKIIQLYKLMIDENKFNKVEYYAKKMKVSSKSIYNYLAELEYYMKKYELDLVKKSGIGIVIDGSDEEKQKLLKEFLHNAPYISTTERREEIYEMLIMYNKTVSINSLAEKYKVSNSSISNDLFEIEKLLTKNELFLEKNHRGTKIIGKEQRIRNAQVYFLQCKVRKNIQIEKIIDLKYCHDLLKRYVNETYLNMAEKSLDFIMDRLSFDIEDIYKQQIYMQVAVFIARISKGHCLVSTPDRPFTTHLHILQTYPVALELCSIFEREINVEIGELDVKWINARIAGVYHENYNQQMKSDNEFVREIVMEMIDFISSVFETNLGEDSILVNGLINHFVPMLSRIINNVQISNPFIEQIKEQYTAMFSVVWLATSKIEKKLWGKDLSEDEMGFLVIYFQAAIERKAISLKVAVITDVGEAQTNLLATHIKNNVPIFNVVEIVKKYNEKEISGFDILITTMPNIQATIPTVTVAPILRNVDMEKITDVYYKVLRKKTKLNSSIFKVIDDNIVLNIDGKNKENLLFSAFTLLKEKGFVKDGFYESMIQRENVSPTNLGKGVAIPHGSDDFVNESKIVIITLKEAIPWGKGNVDTIFLFAIKFDDKEEVKRIFNNIYNLIASDDFIEKLHHCENSNEAVQLLNSFIK